MVQAAIPPILAALGAAGGAATSALGNQSRRSFERPAMPQTAALIATAPDLKRAKLIKKEADIDRLTYLLTQPEIIGILIAIGGIYASNKIQFDDNVVTNEGLQAIATMTSVLIGLGYAGVGDLTSLLAATIAGGVSLTDLMGNIIPDIPDINLDLGDWDWLSWLKDINPAGMIGNLFSSVGG